MIRKFVRIIDKLLPETFLGRFFRVSVWTQLLCDTMSLFPDRFRGRTFTLFYTLFSTHRFRVKTSPSASTATGVPFLPSFTL